MNPWDRYESLIVYYAGQQDPGSRPSPGLVHRLIATESSFRPDAVSPAGAKGLCQFTDAAWIDWGEGGDPFNPEDSIKACCRYLSHLYGRYGEIPEKSERWRSALAAYNCGRGNWNKCLAQARYACEQPAGYSEWVAAGSPPGPWQTFDFASRFLSMFTGLKSHETIGYVRKIMPPDDLGKAVDEQLA